MPHTRHRTRRVATGVLWAHWSCTVLHCVTTAGRLSLTRCRKGAAAQTAIAVAMTQIQVPRLELAPALVLVQRLVLALVLVLVPALAMTPAVLPLLMTGLGARRQAARLGARAAMWTQVWRRLANQARRRRLEAVMPTQLQTTVRQERMYRLPHQQRHRQLRLL